MNSLDDLKVPPVLMGGALLYLCGCHYLSFRSGLAGGGDGGIGLSRRRFLRFHAARSLVELAKRRSWRT